MPRGPTPRRWPTRSARAISWTPGLPSEAQDPLLLSARHGGGPSLGILFRPPAPGGGVVVRARPAGALPVVPARRAARVRARLRGLGVDALLDRPHARDLRR